MDGFAFHFSDLARKAPLKITLESPAGNTYQLKLPHGEAARIFTGAPLPEGADTVVMQEKTIAENHHLVITDTELKEGSNVRKKGAEIGRGALALSRGTTLTPAAIGFLAATGNEAVPVIPSPSVCIILTGNELQSPGMPLEYGQVYDSNSFALRAALKQCGIEKISIINAKDDINELISKLTDALSGFDLILLSGGVSVGDYDFVVKAADALKITQLFHRVKQRPGKPLYFGKQGSKLIFGLPGNPSSVLSCFYHYVFPAIRRMQNKDGGLKTRKAILHNNYKKAAGLTHFLKGWFDGETVSVLEAQESFRMVSFAKANCLIEIEEDITEIKKGDGVNIHLLPNF
jgi:molybdopterin molybdotransferase